MRALLDHSGYDLLNLGDVAMLQVAVTRTRRLWPDADIDVVTYAPDRLRLFCPGTRPVRLAVAGQFPLAHRSKRIQIGLDQVHKMTVPHLRTLPPLWRLLPRERRVEADPTLLQAIDGADVVLAGGGGYLADPFWWHGIGVLSVLEMAQRQGKPTAMFGQGVGPLTHRGLTRLTRRVVPRVDVVGLREGVRGPELLERLGVPAGALRVTGDDALELAVVDVAQAGTGLGLDGLGLNVRVAAYAGVERGLLPVLSAAVRRATDSFDTPVVALPVSLYPEDAEPEAIAEITPPGRRQAAPSALQAPSDLVAAAGRCRVVLTGSYHAAVFALAQGVPAVCLVRSAYYAGKFGGLAALFPTACSVVGLDDPALPTVLDRALAAAWQSGTDAREAARRSARAQVRASREAYECFGAIEGGRRTMAEDRPAAGPRQSRPGRSAGRLKGPVTSTPATPATTSQTDAASASRGGAEPGSGPFLLGEVELSETLPALPSGRAGRAQLLVRLFTEPLGLVELPVPAEPAEVANAVWAALGSEINERVAATEGPALDGLVLIAGIRLPGTGCWLAERARVLAGAPPISVILCTRDRTDALRTSLDRLRAQVYPDFEIIVVDNAPTTDAAHRLVTSLIDFRVRYVVEPRPGLSRARNTGLAAARYDVLAFIDDDESADVHWLAEIARGFASAAHVGCVSGMILPAELETRPQLWFEQYGGHSKGRGFRRAVFEAATEGGQSPLYPLPPFGAGGNMAFTRAALERIGGFDEALGAGTPSRGAEDTAAFTDVLLAGFRLVYQPSAFVRHTHFRTEERLRAQLFGYGLGLTAYYTRILLRSPRQLPRLIGLIPTAWRDMFGKDSTRAGSLPADFPRGLLVEMRHGMTHGASAYVRSRHAVRREKRGAGAARRAAP